MMSLSNSENDQFEPIAVGSLESFSKEHSNRTEETKPDFDRFKALFEKSEFGKKEFNEFIVLYDDTQEEEIVFQHLIDLGEESAGPDQSDKSDKSKENSQDLRNSEIALDKDFEKSENTPEEKGYRQGFEKDLEEGKREGFKDGFKKGEEQGFEDRERKGIEQGTKQGLEKGVKESQAKGTIQVREGAVEILNLLEQSLKTADQTLDLLVEKYKTSVISLIGQVAKKIIMEEMEIDDEIVKSMIFDSFKTLVQKEEVVLSVSQDDYEYIEMIKDEFFETVDSLTSVSVRSDPSIKRGSCKIETITASISSDVESRLETIFETVKTARIKSSETI